MIIAVLGSRLLGPFGLDAQGRRSPKRLGEDGFGTYGPHPEANDPVSSAAPLNTLGLVAAGLHPPRPSLNSQVTISWHAQSTGAVVVGVDDAAARFREKYGNVL